MKLPSLADTSPGSTKPGSVGHEGQAAVSGHTDPSVGHRLLRSPEGRQRRGSQVMCGVALQGGRGDGGGGGVMGVAQGAVGYTDLSGPSLASLHRVWAWRGGGGGGAYVQSQVTCFTGLRGAF